MTDHIIELQSSSEKIFKPRYLLWLILLLPFLLAVFSHDRADLALLEGGVNGDYYRNWIGVTGAKTAQILFYLFGLSVYPLTLLFVLSVLRSFLPVPLKRHGYFFAILLAVLGMTILFAMWPERFSEKTDAMGLGRMERPELALSGGVIGSKLAAPTYLYDNNASDTGWIRQYIGTVGTAVVAGLILAYGFGLIFFQDWFTPAALLVRHLRSDRSSGAADKKQNGKADKTTIRDMRAGSLEEKGQQVKDDDDEPLLPPSGTNASGLGGRASSVASEPEEQENASLRPPALLSSIKSFFSLKSDSPAPAVPMVEYENNEIIIPAESAAGDSGKQRAPSTQIVDTRRNERYADEGGTAGGAVVIEETAFPRRVNQNEEEDDYIIAPPAPLPGQVVTGTGILAATGLGRPSASFPQGGEALPSDLSAASRAPLPPQEEVRQSFQRLPSPQPGITRFSQERPNYDAMHPQQSTASNQTRTTLAHECPDFVLPPVSLLDKQVEIKNEDGAHIESSRDHLQTTLESFNIDGHVSEIVVGPRVTRFVVTLAQGVKVEKVTGIQSNIAMELAAESIRILAPIPGKSAVGIEVPNKESSMVYIRSLMESSVWRESKMGIPIILGRDIAGKVMVADLAKAPHLLIAGSTGSGKSVCMNTLIMSLLFKFSPADMRLILVDPKVVELEMYRPLPHLITPVVNDPKKVPLALRWGVNEMERRYKVLAKVKAKNLAGFNSRPPDSMLDDDGNRIPPKLPLLVIIVDELADIMMTDAKSDVETSICRIAQKGRAAGIHLVIATQTPRKDVVTGLIKANLPTKIAFKVGSNMDSRVILDEGGAEKLLGMGDMLFKPPGASGLERIQGSMVSDPEIQKVVDFVSAQVDQHFDTQVIAEDVEVKNGKGADEAEEEDLEDEDDIHSHVSSAFVNSIAAKYLLPGDSELLRKALEIIINEQKASTSYLQRRLGIGYNKSAELMDKLEQRGIISEPLPGGQKREILICDGLETADDLEN